MSFEILRQRSPHSSRLEQYLGPAMAEGLSRHNANWYGPPVPVIGAPGKVYMNAGGDYSGRLIEHGRVGVAADVAEELARKAAHKGRRVMRAAGRVREGRLNTGFASLGDLISEATTGGKAQRIAMSKLGPTKTVNRGAELFFRAQSPVPTAEGTGEGGATGTGRVCTRTTTGALGQADPGGSDTLHVIGGTWNGSVGTNWLLLYDRLWDMNHVLTVDPRSCDAANVPTRYQTTGLAPGNFLSGDVSVVLPAASNTATFDYIDESGNNATSAAVALLTAAVVGTIVLTGPNWFVPLLTGDSGVRSLQNSANAVNLSAAYASGEVCWFIGHPLLWIPIPEASRPVVVSGFTDFFQFAEVLAGACLAYLELPTGTVTATQYWGTLTLVAG